MEDIRPYIDQDEDVDTQSDDSVEWDLARLGNDDELPFHVPRD